MFQKQDIKNSNKKTWENKQNEKLKKQNFQKTDKTKKNMNNKHEKKGKKIKKQSLCSYPATAPAMAAVWRWRCGIFWKPPAAM